MSDTSTARLHSVFHNTWLSLTVLPNCPQLLVIQPPSCPTRAIPCHVRTWSFYIPCLLFLQHLLYPLSLIPVLWKLLSVSQNSFCYDTFKEYQTFWQSKLYHNQKLHDLALNNHISSQELIWLCLSDWRFSKRIKASTMRSQPSPLITTEWPVPKFWVVYITSRSTPPFDKKTSISGFSRLLTSNKANIWLFLILGCRLGFFILS